MYYGVESFICIHFYFVFKGTFTQLLESFDVQPCSLLQQGLFATDGQTDWLTDWLIVYQIDKRVSL